MDVSIDAGAICSNLCALTASAIECSPREIEQLAMPPKMFGTDAIGIARDGQEPKQYIFTKLVHALPSRTCATIADDLKTVPLGNTIEHFKVYVSPNYIDVRQLGVVFKKTS